MTNDTDDRATSPPAGGSEAKTGGTQRWLSTLRARLGLGGQQTLRETLAEALQTEDRAETAFSTTERDMLLRLLRFGELRVDDVMVPRADIIAIDEQASIAELIATFKQAGVSRVPLFQETLDDPRGMVHIKDLLRYLAGDVAPRDSVPEDSQPAIDGEAAAAALRSIDLDRPIKGAQLRREVLYIPASMPAINLLIRMQSTRNHMALVVDEYGGTDGLVTIEDLIEQVIGEIEDEHDVAEAANIIDDEKLGLVAQARTPVTELEAHLGMKLVTPEEAAEIDTLGGLVFSIVGRIPSRGELVRHQTGVEFEVLDADPRRIKSLKVHRARGADRGDAVSAANAASAATPSPGGPKAGAT